MLAAVADRADARPADDAVADVALARVPALPVYAVHDAIADEDWDTAMRLLDRHHAEIVFALSRVDLKTAPRQPWLDLLDEHRHLLDALRIARDAASAELASFSRDRRGTNAWLRELA